MYDKFYEMIKNKYGKIRMGITKLKTALESYVIEECL